MESLLELPPPVPPHPKLDMLPMGVIVRPGIGDPSVGVLLSSFGNGEGVSRGLGEEWVGVIEAEDVLAIFDSI